MRNSLTRRARPWRTLGARYVTIPLVAIHGLEVEAWALGLLKPHHAELVDVVDHSLSPRRAVHVGHPIEVLAIGELFVERPTRVIKRLMHQYNV